MAGTAAALKDARVTPGRVHGDRWLVGGVAAELARRLRASSAFIRALIVTAMWLQPTGVLVAYAAAAALLPRGDRVMPGWSGFMAAARVGLLLLVPISMNAGGIATNDLFASGPEVWIAIGGIALASFVVLLASGPSVDAVDEARCRTLVLGAVPVLALAAAVVAGMVLAPDPRWERLLAAAVAVLGVVLAVTVRRSELARAAVVPAVLLAGALLLLVSAGARLQGGVGPLHATPAGQVEGTVVARRAIGDVTVDLSAIENRTGEVTVHASTGVGDIRVVLPNRAAASATVRVGRGAIREGDYRGGIGLRRTLSGPPTTLRTDPSPLRVRVVLDAGLGTVRFERANRGARQGRI